MSASNFATLPLETRIRQGAAAVLLSQGTVAGLNVNDSPLDPIQPDDLCGINLFSQAHRMGNARAGGRPGFDAEMVLQIQFWFQSADQKAAVLQTDILKQQIFDALFEDPIWIGAAFAPPPSEIEEDVTHTKGRELYLVERKLGIHLPFKDFYTARGTSVLSPNGPPGLPTVVVAPLLTAKNTIVAGQAPALGGQGEQPTNFGSTNSFPP